MPEILKVTSPFDRHFIREFPLAGDKEAEQALSKAYALFRDPSRHLPKYLRIEILEKLAALMSLQVEELTRIAAEEGGKPYKDSKVEVLRAINGVKLAADPRIGYLTFIGSHDVGWRLRTILAPGTRVALGHGGVAPVIVDETADLSAIIQPIAKGGFYHAGQVCVSVQKVFVHESRAREFAEKLAEEAEKLIVGDPLDPNTDVGPMIAESEVNRVREWVEEAISNGAENLSAKLQAPNTKLNPKSQAPNTKLNSNANSKNQNLIRQIAKSPNRQIAQSSNRPIVLYSPPESCKVSREEVFGPVICVYPYSKLEEAIARANSLRYAFQASIFTKNIDTAMEAAQKINASAVMINDHTAFRVDWMPFGGRDESGIGTGGIPYSMHEMCRSKLIVFKPEK